MAMTERRHHEPEMAPGIDRHDDAPEDDLRAAAIERIKKKHDFYPHLLAYVMVNALLVGIWAVTGADFFWPLIPILGWGIGVAFHAWDTFSRFSMSEDKIQREIRRLR
jgi:2TM domain-containing protein